MKKKPIVLRINDLLKNCLKKTWLGETLYKKILQPIWLSYRLPRARKLMNEFGYDILARVHSAFRKHHIPYYCDAGTLLGFVRDGGFIKGDADFDFSVLPEYGSLAKALRALLSEGYRFVYAYKFQGRLLEFTVMDPKIQLTMDVFQSEYVDDTHKKLIVRYLRWFKGRNYPTPQDNSVLEFQFAAPTCIKEMVVHGVTVDVPENAEAILDDEYGPWRKPDPNFKSDMIPHVEAPYFAHRLTEEEARTIE